MLIGQTLDLLSTVARSPDETILGAAVDALQRTRSTASGRPGYELLAQWSSHRGAWTPGYPGATAGS